MTKTFLSEGDSIEVKGSGKKPYLLRKVGGVIDCSCPAWKNVGGPIDLRVCKHIRANVDRACLLPQALAMYDSKAAKPVKGGKGAPGVAKPAAVKKDTAPPVLLAHKYSEYDEPIDGWWVSEKLDGVRAWWDGEQFWSRLGNVFHAPEWFKAEMPPFVMDGELFAGRKMFNKTISAVRKMVPDDGEWEKIVFMVFDGGWLKGDDPAAAGTFEERYAYLKQELVNHSRPAKSKKAIIQLVKQTKCKNENTLTEHLTEIEKLGGEGLMLREPGSVYDSGKSWTLLKVKSFIDDEGIVTEYAPGRGKHKGVVGALWIKWNGVKFKAGTGLKNKHRKNPPSIGSKVTFRYNELTPDGIPRFPRFIAARDYE